MDYLAGNVQLVIAIFADKIIPFFISLWSKLYGLAESHGL